MERIADVQFRALLAWVERERALERLIERGKLTAPQAALRRQTSLHRLLHHTERAV